MTERSLLGFFGVKKSRPMTTVESLCPVCHNARDPRWSGCPYCDAAKKAGQPTGMASSGEFSSIDAVSSAGSSPGGGRRRTQLDDEFVAAPPVPPVGGHRKNTLVDPNPEAPPGVGRHAGGARRLMGILQTFTWSSSGELFKIFDGRNYVGSGTVAAANDAQCDVLIDDDPVMSSSHCMILCQNGKYIISDLFSTNGTFVNDVQIDTRGQELVDFAVIKAGTTVFTFQKITAAGGATVAGRAAGPARQDAAAPESHRRPTDVD